MPRLEYNAFNITCTECNDVVHAVEELTEVTLKHARYYVCPSCAGRTFRIWKFPKGEKTIVKGRD